MIPIVVAFANALPQFIHDYGAMAVMAAVSLGHALRDIRITSVLLCMEDRNGTLLAPPVLRSNPSSFANQASQRVALGAGGDSMLCRTGQSPPPM